MELNLDFQLDQNGVAVSQRVKDAERKKALKEYQPTMNEIWYTGYETHTGNTKIGIFKTKLTDSDKRKLDSVQMAIERGELGVGVDDLKKFTKAHALRLYQVLIKQNREATIKRMIDSKPQNYILVDNIMTFVRMCELLDAETVIALDTETTGLDYIDNDFIVGVSLSLPQADRHYYIPFRHTTNEKMLPEKIVIEGLRPYLQDPNLLKVLHNAKFDIHMLIKEGIDFHGFHFDTMVGFFLLSENEISYALKNLSTKFGKYFGFEDKSSSYEELFGKGGFEGTPLDIGTVYACKDTHLTWELYKFIQSQYDRIPNFHEIYNEMERDITLVCVHMEQAGFLIDLEFAEEYKKTLTKEITDLDVQIKYHFGDININSNQQLGDVLFNTLKLPDRNKGSVDASTLKALESEHEGIGVLLKYRELNKLLTTYIEPLPQMIAKRDGRLHGQFKQSGTVTGRFSSSNPNLQNIPNDARKLIVAPKGKVIIGIDFSQIEPRVLADMSGDSDFKQPYVTGTDIYSSLASKTFKMTYEQCLESDSVTYKKLGMKKHPRKMMKTGLLAAMYGTSMYTLSQQLEITVPEAEQFLEDFYEGYQGVSSFVLGNQLQIADHGFVTTMFGRKRRFIGHQEKKRAYDLMTQQLVAKYKYDPKRSIWSYFKEIPYDVKRKYADLQKEVARSERQCTNFRIQGSAAEIMKIAMIRLWKYVTAKGWKLLCSVHDECLIEAPETITLEEIEEMESLMINAVKLSVPIKVDTEFSRRWGEGVSKEKWFANKGEIG
jgi:DNA polymerase I